MQGYITLATGKKEYFDMAENLLRSLRKYDPERAVCLIHDGHAADFIDVAQFDHDVVLPPKAGYKGCLDKTRVYDYSPYAQTMFIDSDCIMVRKGIDQYWEQCQGAGFTMTGDKKVTGHWNNLDIEDTTREFGIDYVVQMNSGVFFFEKGDRAKAVFDTVAQLIERYASKLSNVHAGVQGQLADEPFFGTAMGIHRIEPIHQVGTHSLMVTTWRAGGYRKDELDGGYTFKKFNRFLWGLPFLPTGWVEHAPVLMHFINCKPRHLYNAVVAELR